MNASQANVLCLQVGKRNLRHKKKPHPRWARNRWGQQCNKMKTHSKQQAAILCVLSVGTESPLLWFSRSTAALQGDDVEIDCATVSTYMCPSLWILIIHVTGLNLHIHCLSYGLWRFEKGRYFKTTLACQETRLPRARKTKQAVLGCLGTAPCGASCP